MKANQNTLAKIKLNANNPNNSKRKSNEDFFY